MATRFPSSLFSLSRTAYSLSRFSVRAFSWSRMGILRFNAASSSFIPARTITNLVADHPFSIREESKLQLQTDHEKTTFGSVGLHPALVQELQKLGFEKPFGIQARTLEITLKDKDLIVRAATGTGKTLAFVLPIVQKLGLFDKSSKPAHHIEPRALIIAPTRELALQTYKVVNALEQVSQLKSIAIYGGSDFSRQIRQLRLGVDIVIGTPGRINDLIEQKALSLRKVKIMVLDEADEMITPSFMEQIKGMFVLTAAERQTLLFSATLPPDITHLVQTFMKNPEIVDVTEEGQSKLPENLQLEHIVLPYNSNRAQLVANLILVRKPKSAIVFTNTKIQTMQLASYLSSHGINVASIHGDLNQQQREFFLSSFRKGESQVLVATDVAARGIDIQSCDLVIQPEPPTHMDTFVHRSGRTGRAGKHGTSVLITGHSLDETKFVISLKRQGISLINTPAPTVGEITSNKAMSLIEKVKEVNNDQREAFMPWAEELLTQASSMNQSPASVLAALMYWSSKSSNKAPNNFESQPRLSTHGRRPSRHGSGGNHREGEHRFESYGRSSFSERHNRQSFNHNRFQEDAPYENEYRNERKRVFPSRRANSDMDDFGRARKYSDDNDKFRGKERRRFSDQSYQAKDSSKDDFNRSRYSNRKSNFARNRSDSDSDFY